jgi:hypothetical protein
MPFSVESYGWLGKVANALQSFAWVCLEAQHAPWTRKIPLHETNHEINNILCM